MEDVAWKCTTAFLLGAATHYLLSSHLHSSSSNSPLPAKDHDTSNNKGNTNITPASSGVSPRSSSDSSDDWEGADSASWVPHKMVMCVRTDLKMGKGCFLIIGIPLGQNTNATMI